MIDCIQGTSKATKKIFAAVPLISWHCQVLTVPVSNHWQKVIPGPAPHLCCFPLKGPYRCSSLFLGQPVRSFRCLREHPPSLLSQVMGVINVLTDLPNLQMCLILPGYNSKPAKTTRCLSAACITVQMIIWLVGFQIPGTGRLGEFRITFISQAI